MLTEKEAPQKFLQAHGIDSKKETRMAQRRMKRERKEVRHQKRGNSIHGKHFTGRVLEKKRAKKGENKVINTQRPRNQGVPLASSSTRPINIKWMVRSRKRQGGWKVEGDEMKRG